MEKENNTDESDFSENEIPDLNSLKPFEFEPKTNVGDINSSLKQPSEVFCNKRCSQKFGKTHKKTPVPESPFKKKRLWHMRFPVNFEKFP